MPFKYYQPALEGWGSSKLYIIKKVGGILCSVTNTFYKVKKVYCIREMRLKNVGVFFNQCFSRDERMSKSKR